MQSKEIIRYTISNETIKNRVVREAIDYALLSIPFTFDRLGNRNLTKNITNIAKGKFAENYFYDFCASSKIILDIDSLTTPFYQADKKDFLFKGIEWDLKNNYLQHDGDSLLDQDYIEQLALIPNRGPWDQWSKRQALHSQNALGTGYIFTFMKKSDLTTSGEFLRIKMNLDQKNFLLDLYETYQGKHQYKSPYEDVAFWNKFHNLGPTYEFEMPNFPDLIITGIALKEDFPKFSTFKPSDVKSHYLRTIIENMGTPIRELRSFRDFAGLT